MALARSATKPNRGSVCEQPSDEMDHISDKSRFERMCSLSMVAGKYKHKDNFSSTGILMVTIVILLYLVPPQLGGTERSFVTTSY